MTGNRIVSRHLTKRAATRKLAKLKAWQERADGIGALTPDEKLAVKTLALYGINSVTPLSVAHERYLVFKWAVVTPA